MGTRPRNKSTHGSWSDSRIDGAKPFNLRFYSKTTTIDRWTETSFGRQGKTVDVNPNSFSIEKICYPQGMGSRDYKGCYYPTVDGSGYGKDRSKGYGTPTLIFTLHNDKGESVGYTNTTYNKYKLTESWYAFNPMTEFSFSKDRINQYIDQNKLGNDGKVYGKAFVALFPALPDLPQVHHSIYETHSAESVHRQYFTQYDEAKYLSQLDGRLASNIVNFQIQIRDPTPIITVKKKQVIVI